MQRQGRPTPEAPHNENDIKFLRVTNKGSELFSTLPDILFCAIEFLTVRIIFEPLHGDRVDRRGAQR